MRPTMSGGAGAGERGGIRSRMVKYAKEEEEGLQKLSPATRVFPHSKTSQKFKKVYY